MDKYAIDRLIEDNNKAVAQGLMPSSALTPVRLYLEKRSKLLAPQTEVKEIMEDVEGIQVFVSDTLNDDPDIQAMLAGVWCRLDELKGMVTVDG
jgi:hypothetical protein